MTALPRITTPDEWQAAREALLVDEKAHMRAKDALSAKRRRMPMTPVRADYAFEAPDGSTKTLLDLFDGRRQLIVYRFFFDPDMSSYPERGCTGCSMMLDQYGNLSHPRQRDLNVVIASAGEQQHLQRYREQMGWEVPWYRTTDSFSKDMDVDQWHGTNVFLRDGDDVYRTYFVDNRGDEQFGSVWSFLDVAPYGRQEPWEDSPEGWPQSEAYTWWDYHDRYEHP